MNTSTFTNNVLVVFLAAILSVAATVAIVGTAHATYRAAMTIRITDRSEVEAQLRPCPSGYLVGNRADAGSQLVPLQNERATLRSAAFDDRIDPGFYCAELDEDGNSVTRLRGYPSSGVDVQMSL